MSFGDIIAKVKAHPELWQSSHPFYRHRAVSASTWKEIAAELKADEITVRKRWKHLKDQYRKEQKKLMSNCLPMSFWHHYNELHFLSSDLQLNMSGVGKEDDSDKKSNSDSDDAPLKAKKRRKTVPTASPLERSVIKTRDMTGIQTIITRSPDAGKLNLILNKLHAMEESVEDWNVIKKRWKHLKDTFRKEVKKVTSNQIALSSWLHYNELQFLGDEITKKSKKEESEASETESESDDKPLKSTKRVLKRKRVESAAMQASHSSIKFKKIMRSLNTLSKSLEESTNFFDDDLKNDSDYMFLVSLMPTMIKLSDMQRLHFRGKINNWLLNALMENEYSDGCESKVYMETQIDHPNVQECKVEIDDSK